MNTRLVALVALGALVLGGLGGGVYVIVDLARGDGGTAYCDALTDDQQYFAEDGTGALLLDHGDELRDLADKAPDDLSDEWQTVNTALAGLADALDAAGVRPEDFSGGRAPASLSQEEQQKIAAAASQLTEPDVVDAFRGIDQQAKDVCKIQLGL